MEATFWGVRGSVPAPGPEMNRYGGNTACVELRTASGALFMLDIGTGAIPFGRKLMADAFGKGTGEVNLFLSHAHWDHIQGFPFFAPVFVPGNRFVVHGPGRSSSMLEGILEGQMNPHFSPLYTMRNLGASIDLVPVDGAAKDPSFDCGEVRIKARLNPHGATQALAYRFEENGRSLVYASDAGYPAGGPSADVRALYHGADVLIHDCTYSPEDRAHRLARGFSSIADAAQAAVEGEVKKLVMFHYDQDYSDDVVDALAERTRRLLDELGGTSIELVPAREGLTLLV
ncbi:MAG: beta-lactamase domain protein [Myxococcales bacterium]|nr:beta-lactamase domain protein [Myxococcales bacterium]